MSPEILSSSDKISQTMRKLRQYVPKFPIFNNYEKNLSYETILLTLKASTQFGRSAIDSAIPQRILLIG